MKKRTYILDVSIAQVIKLITAIGNNNIIILLEFNSVINSVAGQGGRPATNCSLHDDIIRQEDYIAKDSESE